MVYRSEILFLSYTNFILDPLILCAQSGQRSVVLSVVGTTGFFRWDNILGAKTMQKHSLTPVYKGWTTRQTARLEWFWELAIIIWRHLAYPYVLNSISPYMSLLDALRLPDIPFETQQRLHMGIYIYIPYIYIYIYRCIYIYIHTHCTTVMAIPYNV